MKKIQINPIFFFTISIFLFEIVLRKIICGTIFDKNMIYFIAFSIPIILLFTVLTKVFKDPENPIILFIIKNTPVVMIAPINGMYGNLTEQENVDLTAALKPQLTVPCHFGMFASHGGNPGLWKDLLEQQLPEQPFKLFTMGEGIVI